MKIILPIKVFSLSCMLVSLGCSSKDELHENSRGRAFVVPQSSDDSHAEVLITPAPEPSTPDEKKEELLEANTEEMPLNLLKNEGSQVRFIDAQGLSLRYARIFPKNANGYAHCAGSRPREYADCFSSIFTSFERVSMGNFELQSISSGRGGQNVKPVQNMTLNYTRTLRAALARECQRLTSTEFTAVLANKSTSNILIKSLTPSAGDFEDFFKLMMGIKSSQEKIDISADKYAAAYKEIVEAAQDKPTAQRAAFAQICVAIAMDPQVILY